jgi:ATP-dependent helicase/nuclease subunit A
VAIGMEIRLNDEQIKAAMSDKDTVIVSAGAGSGKTAVLTSRYLWLIDTCKISPESILTITFTKKAAMEMRERILNMLGDDNQYLRQQVLRAQICTIHSFCEEILREYALEAGIDPAYRVLDEAESLTLLYSVFELLKHKIWHLADKDEKYKKMQQLLFDHNVEKLQVELFDLYRVISTRGLSAKDINIPNEPVIKISSLEIIKDIENLISSSVKLTESVKMLIEEIIYKLSLGSDFNDDIIYLEVNKLIGKVKGDLWENIVEKISLYRQKLLEKKIYPYITSSINLLIDIEEMYNEEKIRRGLIDYNDMMRLSRKLLNDVNEPGAKESYNKKYKHIMVDEFQDTSFLQYDIISAVRGNAKLFLVGDVKQSIYGFNGSDIKLYTDIEKAILADDNGERVVMSKNYRTQKEIIENINSIFLKKWSSENKNDNLFEYEELDAMADKEFISDVLTEIMSINIEGSAEELRKCEGRWISDRIRQMVEYEGIKYSDILILLRSTTDVKLYEDELSNADIPCYVVKGRGFYKSAEIRDIIAMINCAMNPMDDIALSTVLRSPMVKLSDDALFWLINDKGDLPNIKNIDSGRLWIRLNNWSANVNINKSDKYKIEIFLRDLQTVQQQIPEGNPITIIDAILKYSGYTQVLLMSGNGLQKYANLMKFREVATEFNSRGIFDLKEFTRYIDMMEKYMNKEASAPVEAEKSDVVKIMTIHAAKGLESPVVFLADAGRSLDKNTKPLYLLNEKKMLMKYYNMDDDKYVESEDYKNLLNKSKNQEMKEEERLLYVAMTRAKKKLVIVGTENDNESYMKMIKEFSSIPDFNSPIEKILNINNNPELKVKICSSEIKNILKSKKPDSYYNIIKKNISAAEKTDISPAISEIKRYNKKIDNFKLTIKDLYKKTNFGVSRILTYSSCPLKYWFQYYLKPDENLRNEVYEIDDINDEPHGAEFGTKFHFVMQHLQFNDRMKLDTEKVLDEIIELDKNQILSIEERQKIIGYLRKIASLPIFIKLMSAKKVYRELGFVLNINGFTVPGYIDLAAQCDDGWWVVDYKTGSKSLSRHTNQMFIYMMAIRDSIKENPIGSTVIYVDNSKPEFNIYYDKIRMADIEKLIVTACLGMANEIFTPNPSEKCQYCTYKDVCFYLPDNDGQLVMDYGIF